MTKRSYNEIITAYKNKKCNVYSMECNIETCPIMKCNRVRERVNSKRSNFVIVNKPKDVKVDMNIVDRVVDRIKSKNRWMEIK